MVRKLMFSIFLFGASLYSSTAFAYLPYAITDAEVAMLPAGCQAKLKGINPSGTDWALKFGDKVWPHMHHFCHGLKFINRARFTFDRNDKRQYLKDAIDEFDYVLAAWPADSPMVAEAKARRAEAVAMQKLQ